MKLIYITPLLVMLAIGCGPEATDNLSDMNDQRDSPSSTPIDTVDDQLVDESPKDVFSPDNFISGVNNPYFSIVPGRKYFLDGRDAAGRKIHKELLSSDRTKEILGVTTQAIWEREWMDDSLVSDSKKWYAQDREGNVWLFGEDELEIFGGFIKSNDESWEAGQGEAKAGIVVPAEPKVGDSIAREYNGIETEKSDVLAVSEDVRTAAGQYEDCLKLSDASVGEDEELEHTYYCQGVGNLSLEIEPDTFGKVELTRIEDNFSTAGMDITYQELKVTLTEAEAQLIALDAINDSDEVESISIKLRNDDPAYFVNIIKDNGNVVTVYVDINTGAVLGTS